MARWRLRLGDLKEPFDIATRREQTRPTMAGIRAKASRSHLRAHQTTRIETRAPKQCDGGDHDRMHRPTGLRGCSASRFRTVLPGRRDESRVPACYRWLARPDHRRARRLELEQPRVDGSARHPACDVWLARLASVHRVNAWRARRSRRTCRRADRRARRSHPRADTGRRGGAAPPSARVRATRRRLCA